MTQQHAENMVYFRENTSPSTPAEREPMIPPSCKTEVSHPVALDDAMTVGKFVVNLVITRDCPRTPCWYPYSNPPNLIYISLQFLL